MANENKLSAAVALKVRTGENYLAADGSETETSSRFLQAAALLPAEQFLGLQIRTEKDGPGEMSAFSSAGAYAAPEDLDWIFRDYAEVSPLEPAGAPEGGRRVYLLRPAGAAPGNRRRAPARLHRQTYQYEEPSCSDSFKSLLSELRKAGGTLQIQVYGGAEDAQSRVLVSLPDEMTLRLRAALCLAFPDTLPAGAEPPALEGGELLSACCLEEGLPELLAALIYLTPAWQPPEPDPEDPEEEEEEEPDEEPDRKTEADAFCEEIFGKPESTGTILPDDALLDELDLSVRSYNCLRRAGINTLGELRGMSEEELSHVRNLGRRSMKEVLQKLAEVSGPAPDLPSPTQQLEELIGLEGVKEQVRRIAAFARLRKEMAAQNQAAMPMVLNMEFTGSPGTAKTTVARILAGILHEVGLLPGRGLVEVGRADLVARYVGHTAQKVREVFRRARGKVLFIDEAYSLADESRGSFGAEAINTIVQEMENHRDETVVIFAGYPDEMEDFFARNPGLRSRVPFHIHFEDYSAGEMARITELEAKRRGFSVRPKALEKAEAVCRAAAGRTELGNGRFCRNLAESAILNYAMRVYGQPEAAQDAPAPELALEPEDFRLPEGLPRPERPVIGFRTRPERLSA